MFIVYIYRQLALGLNNSLKIIYILILYSNRRPLPPVPFPADELLREGVEQGNRALIELSDYDWKIKVRN
jgi:hypothetical protein